MVKAEAQVFEVSGVDTFAFALAPVAAASTDRISHPGNGVVWTEGPLLLLLLLTMMMLLLVQVVVMLW